MDFLKRLIVLFYVTLMMFLGCTVLLYAFHFVTFQSISNAMYITYYDETLKFLVGGLAATLLFINFFVYRFFSVNVHRDKIIAFDNPSGRVSVSLMAMEDLVKRSVARLPEIKEVKPIIKASDKGLNIKIRLVLQSEVNIPDIASKVQTYAVKKIQDTIGIEETVNVAIYVGKILPEKVKQKQHSQEKQNDKPEPNIPFHGYRA